MFWKADVGHVLSLSLESTLELFPSPASATGNVSYRERNICKSRPCFLASAGQIGRDNAKWTASSTASDESLRFGRVELPSRERLGGERPRALVVRCGGAHTIVLSSSREVFTFGDNKSGQLGCGDTRQRNKPRRALELRVVLSRVAFFPHSPTMMIFGVYTIFEFQRARRVSCGSFFRTLSIRTLESLSREYSRNTPEDDALSNFNGKKTKSSPVDRRRVEMLDGKSLTTHD